MNQAGEINLKPGERVNELRGGEQAGWGGARASRGNASGQGSNGGMAPTETSGGTSLTGVIISRRQPNVGTAHTGAPRGAEAVRARVDNPEQQPGSEREAPQRKTPPTPDFKNHKKMLIEEEEEERAPQTESDALVGFPRAKRRNPDEHGEQNFDILELHDPDPCLQPKMKFYTYHGGRIKRMHPHTNANPINWSRISFVRPGRAPTDYMEVPDEMELRSKIENSVLEARHFGPPDVTCPSHLLPVNTIIYKFAGVKPWALIQHQGKPIMVIESATGPWATK